MSLSSLFFSAIATVCVETGRAWLVPRAMTELNSLYDGWVNVDRTTGHNLISGAVDALAARSAADPRVAGGAAAAVGAVDATVLPVAAWLPASVDTWQPELGAPHPLYGGMGSVELVDMMPRCVPEGRTAEIAIVRCARTSYSGAPRSAEEDSRLVRRLVRDRHTSPLESVVFQFRMRIPVFVERQLVRHRTARINEQSHRYTRAEDEWYMPELRMQSTANKQGSSTVAVPEACRAEWVALDATMREVFAAYGRLCTAGVSREVARCVLPVGMMTTVMWQIDLNNLLKFLDLRLDAHAQQEMRELAAAIEQLVTPHVPDTMHTWRARSRA